MANERIAAAEAFVRSYRTGGYTAGQELSPRIAADAVLATGQDEVQGHDAVLQRATGQWATTFALQRAVWSDPVEDGEKVTVRGELRGQPGYTPESVDLTFRFNAAHQISRVDLAVNRRPMPTPAAVIPEKLRPVINNARVDERPMVFAYVNESNMPVVSYRGSTTVYSDTQLCIWLRHPEGQLANSIKKNDNVSLTYSNSPGTIFFVTGRARIDDSPEVRDRVFQIVPEVEQNHDPGRTGAALIIEVDRIMGWCGDEFVRMERPA